MSKLEEEKNEDEGVIDKKSISIENYKPNYSLMTMHDYYEKNKKTNFTSKANNRLIFVKNFYIICICHVIATVVVAVDLVQIFRQILHRGVGGVVQHGRRQAGGRRGEQIVVRDGDALSEQLQTVEVDREVAHALLHEGEQEQDRDHDSDYGAHGSFFP